MQTATVANPNSCSELSHEISADYPTLHPLMSWKTAQDGDYATSLHSLFLCLAVPGVKKRERKVINVKKGFSLPTVSHPPTLQHWRHPRALAGCSWPLCLPSFSSLNKPTAPAGFIQGNQFNLSWASVGMGTELGTGAWACLPMSQWKVDDPSPCPGCAAVPRLCQAVCRLQLSLLPAAFWQSWFPAELLPSLHPCQGFFPPGASASLLGGLTRLLLPILPAWPGPSRAAHCHFPDTPVIENLVRGRSH